MWERKKIDEKERDKERMKYVMNSVDVVSPGEEILLI